MKYDRDADLGRKNVFAHFGFTVAKAQAVERSLASLVLYPDLVRLQTQGERDRAARKHHVASTGKLAARLRELGEPDSFLKEFVTERDTLVHRFFWEDRHTAMLASPEGQAALIKQLDALAARFDEIETHIHATMQRLGALELEYSSDPDILPIPRVLMGW